MNGLLNVSEVADYLGVKAAFVYERAAAMGAERLGDGPRAPLRFRLEHVDEWLRSCSTSRGSVPEKAAAKPRIRASARTRGSGTNVVLLPIRGRR